MSNSTAIRYHLPLGGIKFSTNKIYAGIHWTKRKSIKDSIHSYAVGFCRPVKKVESYPVQIEYRFFFRTRALDTLNCAAMAKMFEDAFRSIGILEDDAPKFVARSILEVVVIPSTKRKKNAAPQSAQTYEEVEDYLEISITPYVKP